MGDANVRRPVATRFEHGVDFGLLVHKSPFMADDRDPLVLSNYIFELLEVNPGVAGFLIQLHPDDVDAVVESVTAHAEKGAGTKTTLYVGQEEEEVEEVEEEEEDAGGVGAGGRKEKPHNPLMISVQKVRIRPGKGKGQSDGWFPQPLTHNTRRVCTDDPENKLPMHSLCPTREWEREWYGVTTPNIVAGQGVILFPFGATPPLIGEAEEVVAAEPLGAFNRDPNDLVLTVGGKLVVNHLLEHDFLSAVQLQSLLDDLDRVPLSEKAPIFNENPPIVGRPQDSGTRRTMYGNYGGANHHRHNPHKLHDLPVLKRVADRVLETAKKTVVGGVGWSCTILDMAEISSYDHTPQHLHRDAPPYTIPEGTLIVNCLIMLTHNHEEEDGSHFLFVPSSSSGFPDPWVERAVPFKACRMGGTGWYRQVTITEKEGGVERKTNLTLPSYVWVGGETAKWPQAAEGETVAAFLCLFGMSDPPQRKSYFLLRVCFLWEGEYTGREVWQKLHRGGDIHQVGGYDPPPSVADATAEWIRQYAPKGGRPGKGQTKRGPDVVEPDAPPPLRGKGQTPAPKPSPKPSKVAKVAAAQPPHEALDVEALGASVATHVTDACQVLVEQAAATGVEAALAKGRSADHRSALAKAEKAQGNTQRALDQALNLAAKRGEEVEAMREALREAQEGRRKAEVEVAQLRVEVEGQRRRGDDLGQRLGVAEAQVRSLTSTLCASFGAQQAQQGLAPQGLQSQGSGSRSGSQ